MKIAISSTLVLMLSAAPSLMAAEKNPQPKEPSKTDTNEKTEQKEPQKKPETEQPKTEKSVIFRPSEELSEDYSVPFPTDI